MGEREEHKTSRSRRQECRSEGGHRMQECARIRKPRGRKAGRRMGDGTNTARTGRTVQKGAQRPEAKELAAGRRAGGGKTGQTEREQGTRGTRQGGGRTKANAGKMARVPRGQRNPGGKPPGHRPALSRRRTHGGCSRIAAASSSDWYGAIQAQTCGSRGGARGGQIAAKSWRGRTREAELGGIEAPARERGSRRISGSTKRRGRREEGDRIRGAGR